MHKRELVRIVAGVIVAPLVPILGTAALSSTGTDNPGWFGIVTLFGYLFFCLFGAPVLGILIHRRTLFSCMLGGAATALTPILLLGSLSLFSGMLTLDSLLGLVLLGILGAAGGIVFWLIAFCRAPRMTQ